MNLSVGLSTPGRSVLALIGDRFHNLDYIRVHFNRMFGNASIPYDYTPNYELFAEGSSARRLLEGRRLLCVFRDGVVFPDGYVGPEHYSHYIGNLMQDAPSGARETWVTEEFGEVVVDFVRNGGSLFVCHNSLSIALFSEAFRSIALGVYDGHAPERIWQVSVAPGDHAVVAGVQDFLVTDEQHYPIYDGPEELVLLRGVNRDGLLFTSDSGTTQRSAGCVVAWWHRYGRGRVIVSTIGHNLDALWKRDYWQFQLNAISWLMGNEELP